ncbi:TPA: hypothetical protein ACMDQU_001960 [Vibrio parahaemolyticus]
MDIPEPLDLEKLVAEGIIEKHGKSYYTPDFKSLPRDVSFYVKKYHQIGGMEQNLTSIRHPKALRNGGNSRLKACDRLRT